MKNCGLGVLLMIAVLAITGCPAQLDPSNQNLKDSRNFASGVHFLETGTNPIGIVDKPLNPGGSVTQPIGGIVYGTTATWKMNCVFTPTSTPDATIKSLKLVLTAFGPVSNTAAGTQRIKLAVVNAQPGIPVPNDVNKPISFVLPINSVTTVNGFHTFPIEVTVTADQGGLHFPSRCVIDALLTVVDSNNKSYTSQIVANTANLSF